MASLQIFPTMLVLMLSCGFMHTVAVRVDLAGRLDSADDAPSDLDEVDVEQEQLTGGSLDENLLFADGPAVDREEGRAAKEQEAREAEAKEVADLKAGKKGKSCCVMLLLPKYRDAVDGSCTAEALKQINYVDASNRKQSLDITSGNKTISHPYSDSNPQQVAISWAKEPYGELPIEMTATRRGLFRDAKHVAGSTETLCKLRSCPKGFHEWGFSGFRYDADYSTKVNVNNDRDLKWLEGDIRKTTGTRKNIMVECYSQRFKVPGSKFMCPAGLSDSWSNCR